MPEPIPVEQIQAVADALTAHGVVTLNDLRICLARNVDTSISWVTSQSGANKSLLTAFLIAEVRDDTGLKGKLKLFPYWRGLNPFRSVLLLSTRQAGDIQPRGRWRILFRRKPLWALLRQSAVGPKRILNNWRRYWPDALVIILLPLLVTGLLVRAQSLSKSSIPRIVVKPTASLPAFHQIGGEVELKREPGSGGTLTSLDQVAGLYTLAAFPAGAVLEANKLLSAELSGKMHGRKILSVPLKSGNYSPWLVPPAEAIMVLSARQPEMKTAQRVALNVIVLGIDGRTDMKLLTIAISEADFNTAVPLLASHDLFLSPLTP